MMKRLVNELISVKFVQSRFAFIEEDDVFKVTLYDENTDFIIFYIFIDLYSGAEDLSIAASFFQKY